MLPLTESIKQRFKKESFMILSRKYSLYEEVEGDFWNSYSYGKRGKKNAIVCWMQCILENIVGQNFDLSKPLYNSDYYVLFSKKINSLKLEIIHNCK